MLTSLFWKQIISCPSACFQEFATIFIDTFSSCTSFFKGSPHYKTITFEHVLFEAQVKNSLQDIKVFGFLTIP